MKTIRSNVFETNSSSTHVLTIIKGDKHLQIPKEINFTFGEFGWEYATYYNTYNKCQYLITAICCCDKKTEHYLSKLKSILEKSGIQYTIPEFYWQEYDDNNTKSRYAEMDGYIDHGYELYDFLDDVLSNKQKLFNFLFNDESYVSTGNDNDNGYYIPGIGTRDKYSNYDTWEAPEWDKAKEELQKDFDVYFKGN